MRQGNSWRTSMMVIFVVGVTFVTSAPAGSEEGTAARPPSPEIQAGAAMRDYTELLKAEAQTIREAAQKVAEAAKNDSERIDRALGFFSWFVGGVGTVLVAASGVFLWQLGASTKTELLKTINEKMANQIEPQIQKFQNSVDEALKNEIKNRIKVFRTKFEDADTALKGMADTSRRNFEQIEDQFELLRSNSATLSMEAASPSVAGAQTFGDIRIIWVDDQPKTTIAARAELEKRGIEVDAVDSTELLKAKFSEGKKYALIVSDLKRDGDLKAGVRYLDEIRNNDDLPPRLIFAPQSYVKKQENEINALRRESSPGKVLEPVTSTPEFFTAVFDFLSKARQEPRVQATAVPS